jgi:hypothetical protein
VSTTREGCHASTRLGDDLDETLTPTAPAWAPRPACRLPLPEWRPRRPPRLGSSLITFITHHEHTNEPTDASGMILTRP